MWFTTAQLIKQTIALKIIHESMNIFHLNNAVQLGDEVYLASSDLSYYYNIHNPKAEDRQLIPKKDRIRKWKNIHY